MIRKWLGFCQITAGTTLGGWLVRFKSFDILPLSLLLVIYINLHFVLYTVENRFTSKIGACPAPFESTYKAIRGYPLACGWEHHVAECHGPTTGIMAVLRGRRDWCGFQPISVFFGEKRDLGFALRLNLVFCSL